MELLRLITPAFGALALAALGAVWQEQRDTRADVKEIRMEISKSNSDIRERLARVEARGL